MDIHNQTFKRSFRGFNEEEVDNFLDQVVNDYEHLWRENDTLKEQLARSQKDIEQYKRLEENLKDTLLVAQKTAEEVTTNAKNAATEARELAAKDCQNMRREAELAAKKQLEEAHSAAKKEMDEAHAQAQKEIADAAAQVCAIVAEYDRLVREKNKFLRRVKLTLESGLAEVTQTLEDIPDPEREDRLKAAQGTQAAGLARAAQQADAKAANSVEPASDSECAEADTQDDVTDDTIVVASVAADKVEG